MGRSHSLPDARSAAPAAAGMSNSLDTEGAPETGQVYFVQGGQVRRFQGWKMEETIEKQGRWDVAELAAEMPKLRPPSK